jgi:tRNA pseudouridine32 synthase/23S rRNA pseudouridine746 synthase/23S rRNA pseudouridine1911/1915/1917 synthase
MIEVIYQDADVMVLHKPSGISLLADRSGAPCLWEALPELLNGKPYLVHRLDKPTSGVLLIARHPASQRRLTRAFQKRQIRKFYLAWVRGNPPPVGTIDLPLRKGRKSRYRVAGNRANIELEQSVWHLQEPQETVDGHDSLTRLRCLIAGADRSLVLLQPRTGRTHQLRVHLAWIGHPILGDQLYGDPHSPEQLAPRLQLHCHRLVVPALPPLAVSPPAADWLR